MHARQLACGGDLQHPGSRIEALRQLGHALDTLSIQQAALGSMARLAAMGWLRQGVRRVCSPRSAADRHSAVHTMHAQRHSHEPPAALALPASQ